MYLNIDSNRVRLGELEMEVAGPISGTTRTFAKKVNAEYSNVKGDIDMSTSPGQLDDTEVLHGDGARRG